LKIAESKNSISDCHRLRRGKEGEKGAQSKLKRWGVRLKRGKGDYSANPHVRRSPKEENPLCKKNQKWEDPLSKAKKLKDPLRDGMDILMVHPTSAPDEGKEF